jgi:hypothetical protein
LKPLLQSVVVPELKKHQRKSSIGYSNVHNNVEKSSGSSTEVGCDNGNVTDRTSDLEEIPKDSIPAVFKIDQDEDEELILKDSPAKLRISCSNNELTNKPVGIIAMVDKNHYSETDLLTFELAKNETTDNLQVIEDLVKEFEPTITVEETEEEDGGENDRAALQIMKTNSDILERLLRKKSVPFPEVAVSGKGLVTTQVQPVVPQERRHVSQTSSNSSSISINSNITLQSSPATKPITFNPFPNSGRTNRKPKEVGRKLGLYK